MEAIIAAFLDLRPNSEPNIKHALARYISDDMLRRLRKSTGRNHPNAGQDIIDRVHFELWEAGTAHIGGRQGYAKSLCVPRHFRLKDAIAKEGGRERRTDPEKAAWQEEALKAKVKGTKTRKVDLAHICEHPELQDEEVSDEVEIVGGAGILRDATLLQSVRDLDEQIDVDRFLLENIPDYKKRLAFHLFMDKVPYKSKRGISIASLLKIDESTARDWIENTSHTQGKTRRTAMTNRDKSTDRDAVLFAFHQAYVDGGRDSRMDLQVPRSCGGHHCARCRQLRLGC